MLLSELNGIIEGIGNLQVAWDACQEVLPESVAHQPDGELAFRFGMLTADQLQALIDGLKRMEAEAAALNAGEPTEPQA
jgi:hypothetical protein